MARFKTAWVGMMAVGLVGAGAGIPAYAHHSFAATYLVDQHVTINGTVTEFLFRNPHSFVHMLAKDPKTGQMVIWAIEWEAGGGLGADSINGATLRPGDQVIVTGAPARDAQEHRLRMQQIQRPSDGWKWAGTFG